MSTGFKPMPRLCAGDVIELEPKGALHEVLRVTDCSATVRALARVHRVVRSWKGKLVEFDAPARPFQISPMSCVRVIERRGQPSADLKPSGRPVAELLDQLAE